MRLERAAAPVRVRLLHEHDRLVAGEGRANLAEAVLGEGRGSEAERSGRTRGGGRGKRRRLGAEVAPREEEEDRLRASDVLLERTDIVKIVDLRGASRRHGGCGPQARGRRGRTSRNTLMPGNSSSSSFLMTATAS